MISPRKFSSAVVCAALLLTLLLAHRPDALAQQLPFKYYTTADGVPYDTVAGVVQDSRGLLWVCTSNGLARFDGSRFITYRDTEGLMPQVNHLLEARDGAHWVATNGAGVYRIVAAGGVAPSSRGRSDLSFLNYPVGSDFASMRVNKLYEDMAGRLWAGTDAGLYVLAPGRERFEQFSLGFPEQQERVTQVWDFAEDSYGALWVASKFGLSRILSGGGVRHHAVLPAQGRDSVLGLLRDSAGRLWALHERGLVVFVPSSEGADTGEAPWRTLTNKGAGVDSEIALPSAAGEARIFGPDDGLQGRRFRGIAETPDGHVWVGHESGFSEFDGSRLRNYGEAEGYRGAEVVSICVARDGSLWLGTTGAGLVRLRRSGFTVFRTSDGLGHSHALSLTEDAEGRVYAFDTAAHVNLFDPVRSRFTSVRLRLPEVATSVGWNTARKGVLTAGGEWWVGTAVGLFRFPRAEGAGALAAARPVAHYTVRDGLAYDDVANLFADSRGDLWFSAFTPARVAVTRWERATGRFRHYTEAEGLPSFNAPSGFCEDAAGRVWIGFRDGGVARYEGGRFMLLRAEDGMTGAQVSKVMASRDGSVWAATLEGLAHVIDPGAERPRVRMYTTRDGLFSNHLTALAEDALGRLYVGTANLVDRLDPATGRVEHFDRSDGLTGTMLYSGMLDRAGAVWLATLDGLMRYVPGDEAPRRPPAVYISGLRVAGQPRPVTPLGTTTLPEAELAPDQNNIQVDFYGLAFDLREGVRHQYMLEGSGQGWSDAVEERTLTFARLAPGGYRLHVRAVMPDGLASEPAAFSFRVLRPVWQRWWFLALAALGSGALAYAAYRFRLRRALEVERVRTRIASDLHDDIGASVSRVAMLSEVVKLQLGESAGPAAGLLNEIAESARGLVDSMSDIVWSVDPRRDDMHNVVVRVRQFASDVLEARGISWDFRVSPEVERLKLHPEQRRHLYLIFKEALNNVARHAGDATTVSLSAEVAGGQLVGEVRDDGRGFLPQTGGGRQSDGRGGNGLPNMRDRAAQLGGRLDVQSAPGAGTRLRLTLPLK